MASIREQQKSNLGVLIFGRKRPGFDQEWSRSIRERTLATLQGMGYQCFGAENVVLDDTTIHAAMDTIVAAECKALIVIQPSISDGQFALTIGQRWAHPVILWATPEKQGDGKVSSCALVGQHLWASIYRQAGHPFELVYGGPEVDPTAMTAQLHKAIALAQTVTMLKRSKVGVVGTHVPGFIDLAADPFLIRKTFGLQLHPLSLPQFVDRVAAVDEAAVNADVVKVRALDLPESVAGGEGVTDAALAVNSRYYLSMLELMQEAGLDGLALQCWPELPNVVGQWPYLAVSRLTTEGQVVSIEGDVDGAIAGLMSSLMGMGPWFLTDWLEHDESTIQFWHPGMAPLDMCCEVGGEDGPSLGEHFNGARPFVVDGMLLVGGMVTVSRLWRCDNRYHMTAFEGRAVEPRRRLSGNTLLVEVSGESVPVRFDRLIHAGMPHHVTLHHGEHAEQLRRLARLLSIEWHG